MSLFAWFKDLKEKSPFNTFQKKIERLKALLFVMDEEIEKEHFQQLKGHLHATILIIGSKDSLDNTCLVRLLEKEKEITEAKPVSQKKALLQKFEKDTEKYLEIFVQILRDAYQLCDSALGAWQNKYLLKSTKTEIKSKIIFLERAIIDFRKLASDESKAYDDIKEGIKAKTELPSPLLLEGTMSNGWRLSIIQRVVRQLGAWVEPAGKHAYKIVIPYAVRPHPLSKDLDPYGFAQSLSRLLGISKEKLVKSFNKGEFVE